MLLPNLHILGIQGSGKGTQVAELVKQYGFTPISTGELFRQRAKVEDAYGQYVKRHLEEGFSVSAWSMETWMAVTSSDNSFA